MILRVNSFPDDTPTIMDDIKSISYYDITREEVSEYEEEARIFNQDFDSFFDPDPLSVNPYPDEGGIRLAYVHFRGELNPQYVCYAPGHAFLMNDQGDTIEHL